MTKRIYRVRSREISGLTQNNPAQPGAGVRGRKSDSKNQKNDFETLVSSITDGHSHSTTLDIISARPVGYTSFEETSGGRLHDHSLRFDDNGDIEFYERNQNVSNPHIHTLPYQDALSYVTSGLVRINKSLSSSDAIDRAKALLEQIVVGSNNVSNDNTTNKESNTID